MLEADDEAIVAPLMAQHYRPPEAVVPNGRTIEVAFDALDRMDTIADQGAGQSLADYDYIGAYRELQRTNETNGTRETYLDDAGRADLGYDGLRRPVTLRHPRADNSLIVGFEHTWDRMNNKKIEEKLHDSTNSELYAYDSAYRLRDFQRGTLNSGRTAIVTPSTNSLQQQEWTLDGPGNWAEQTITAGGIPNLEIRDHTSFNEIYVIQEDGAPIAIDRNHDDNGNLTSQDAFGFGNGTLAFEWDQANRLRRVSLASNGTLIATYAYDALSRRVLKVVTNTGTFDGTTHYYYDGWQVVEERNGTDQLTQQYVYGASIDEPLVLDRNLGGGSTATGPGDQRLFYHQNTLYSVFALTDTNGVVVEGYQYDAFAISLTVLPCSSLSMLPFP